MTNEPKGESTVPRPAAGAVPAHVAADSPLHRLLKLAAGRAAGALGRNPANEGSQPPAERDREPRTPGGA
jgi:hypothetical protein